MSKDFRLPTEFTNIPLADLWQYVKISDELIQLHSDDADKTYWQGWHDCIASLLSDLTSKPTIKLRSELADTFTDFRMEDTIEQMARDFDGLN